MSTIEPHEFVPPEPGTRDAEFGWCAREDCGSAADSYAHASEEERREFDSQRGGRIDRREAGHTAPPVIRIPLAGVPSHCPYCGVAAAFPLTVFGNAVHASCPACFRIVAPVAVTSEPTASYLITARSQKARQQAATQQGAPRFALDETKAAEWLARAIAQNVRAAIDGKTAEHDDTLPAISASYRASSGDWATETAFLVALAIDAGIITDTEPSDLGTLTWEYVPGQNRTTAGYRWLLNVGPGTTDDPGELVTMAYPSPEDMWGIGLNHENREIAGIESALSVLREAVSAGNDLAERLTAYVSSLPLAVRAPEVGKLVAMLPEGEWGADELATLAEWLNDNGYGYVTSTTSDIGTEYLCDECWENATELHSVCQDGCSQSLDHVGLCVGRTDILHCTRCGAHDRLTEYDG